MDLDRARPDSQAPPRCPDSSTRARRVPSPGVRARSAGPRAADMRLRARISILHPGRPRGHRALTHSSRHRAAPSSGPLPCAPACSRRSASASGQRRAPDHGPDLRLRQPQTAHRFEDELDAECLIQDDHGRVASSRAASMTACSEFSAATTRSPSAAANQAAQTLDGHRLRIANRNSIHRSLARAHYRAREVSIGGRRNVL